MYKNTGETEQEWESLIMEAKQNGLTIKEIREFLGSKKLTGT